MFSSRQLFVRFCSSISRKSPKWHPQTSTRIQNVSKISLRSSSSSSHSPGVLYFAALPTFLAFFRKEDEDGQTKSFLEYILPEEMIYLFKYKPEATEMPPEERLKIMMKRTILCIQRGEYVKAEQMAHLALRMAQDLQHYDATTLCFDIMANLADSLNQHKKAEKLYTEVLKRLILNGVPQDDIRIIHLSVKVGHIADQMANEEDAVNNYTWAMKQLEGKLRKEPGNSDLSELWGLVNNFYGQLLLRKGFFDEAKLRLQIAYDKFVKYRGKLEPDFVDIVNNLAVAYTHMNDLEIAEKYMNEALTSASMHEGMIESGIYQANKGMILLKKGLVKPATYECQQALKSSKKSKNADGEQQAQYCLQEIAKVLKEEKKAEE